MYVPGEGGVMKKFHVGDTAAALGLAIYVFPRRCFSAMQDFGNEDMPSPVIETLAFKI